MSGPRESSDASGPEQLSSRERVRGVFDQVADNYDLMNDLISLGTHRVMKRMLVELAAVREGHTVLDLATGTGDLAALLAERVGAAGLLIAGDINASMLALGRDKLLDQGIQTPFLQTDAERLPFDDNRVDRITIAFGLRNLAHKETALGEFRRVLKPGGRLAVLEFSHPPLPPVAAAFALYRKTWPHLGRLVTGSPDSYDYLDESITRHPDQEQLLDMLAAAGFVRARHHNLLAGAAAVHLGVKP